MRIFFIRFIVLLIASGPVFADDAAAPATRDKRELIYPALTWHALYISSNAEKLCNELTGKAPTPDETKYWLEAMFMCFYFQESSRTLQAVLKDIADGRITGANVSEQVAPKLLTERTNKAVDELLAKIQRSFDEQGKTKAK